MSRGYRSIVVALVGWLILAASPEKQAADTNQANPQNASAEALQNIATAIQQADKGPEPDAGCEAGQDARNSDLCAQWKAADAAKESADWTRRTFWLGCFGVVIGAATLFAAGFAAWYAKAAAESTERTLRASRAWILLDDVDGPMRLERDPGDEYDGGYKITGWLMNYGSSPARHTSVVTGIRQCPVGENPAPFISTIREDLQMVIGPGKKFSISAFMTKRQTDLFENDLVRTFMFSKVKYFDNFSDDARMTEICMELSCDGLIYDLTHGKSKIEMGVKPSGFHNSAT